MGLLDHRRLGIGHLGGRPRFVACLVASLAVWRWSEGTVSVNTIVTPKVEASTGLRSVLPDARHRAGDRVADTNDLGDGGGASVRRRAAVALGRYAFTQTPASRFLGRFHSHPPLGATLGDPPTSPSPMAASRSAGTPLGDRSGAIVALIAVLPEGPSLIPRARRKRLMGAGGI